MSGTILQIEVQLKSRDDNDSFRNLAAIEDSVRNWLREEFAILELHQDLSHLTRLRYGHHVEKITIVAVTGHETDKVCWKVQDVGFNILIYELKPPDKHAVLNRCEFDGEYATVHALPNVLYDGLLESLYYDPPIGTDLLRFLTRLVTIARTPGLKLDLMGVNKLVLLHGPPGTGKSSLCRAFAHKLAIQMSQHYTSSYLIEINCQALLSKYFSESGKMVRELFTKIMALAADEDCLVSVVIDEIETIAGSRQHAMTSSECTDAVRATNSLLMSLDHLRHKQNVFTFCTTNLLSTIDAAFMDRVDHKVAVPGPCETARYKILRSSLNELHRSEIIGHGSTLKDAYYALDISASEPDLAESQLLVTPTEAQGYMIARKAEGLSGRSLRRLPFMALATEYTASTCTMEDALKALRSMIAEEKEAAPAFLPS